MNDRRRVILGHAAPPLPAALVDRGKLGAFRHLLKHLVASPTGQPNSRGEHQGDDLDNRLPPDTVERVAP
jgi:hypothetical protein